MEHVDLVVKNAKVFNSYLKSFRIADVYVKNEHIFYIDVREEPKEAPIELIAQTVFDGTGYYMIPGLIDIHMHIESSMMTPHTFSQVAGTCGVTTVVSEPHEMANVMGMQGIYEMMEDGQNLPMDIFYGIPSSVPSTSEKLETTGGIIDCEMMKELLSRKEVVCVGEIMNYRQIIQRNDLEIKKFLDYLKKEKPSFVIEGHCPSLVDLDLAKFLFLGIDGDHTEHTLKEIRQRFENGMFVELQDKMLKPEILDYIKENRLFEHCAFVTDDTMADELHEKGQLNNVIKTAVEKGFPLEEAISCATFTSARRMNLKDRGSIAPGKLADFILLTHFSSWKPDFVFKNGNLITENLSVQTEQQHCFPEDYYHSVRLPVLKAEDFEIVVMDDRDKVSVRVIQVSDGKTQTNELIVEMPVKNHQLCWEDTGCMFAMVIERHGKNGNIGYGFVTGDCFKHGAAATTYFHDHHNLFVIGSNIADMKLAIDQINRLQGGILTVVNGTIESQLPLPVAGILSNQSIADIGQSSKEVRESLHGLGYHHYNPIMSLCTLGLPVSPALKLTDKGLIDVKKGMIVPLIL